MLDSEGNIGVSKLDHPQRVKRVIFLFMNGGCSSIDSFDPKPALEKYDGQPLPGGTIKTERRTGELMKSPFKFKKYGQCGMDVSELWPHLGEVADDICWVRSVYTDIPNHEPSCLMMNTGANQAGRPSMGAWLTYGLGTENQNLPGYVVLCPDVPTTVGPPLWSNGFLPAVNQGTFISNRVQTAADAAGGGAEGEMMTEEMPEDASKEPEKDKDGKEKLKKVVIERNFDPKKLVSYVNNPKFSLARAEARVGPASESSKRCARPPPARTSRWKASSSRWKWRTACKPKRRKSSTSARNLKPRSIMYGPGPVARGALTAVRLAEKGVRMTQVYYSKGDPWDAHGDIFAHKVNAKNSDQAFAAVIKDLKGRGLWKDTLVVCGSEFGRTPVREVGGGQRLRQARPRPQSVRVHHVAGRRRGQGRHHLWRHRRFRLQSHRKARSRPRHPRDHPVSLRHRPHEANLSV